VVADPVSASGRTRTASTGCWKASLRSAPAAAVVPAPAKPARTVLKRPESWLRFSRSRTAMTMAFLIPSILRKVGVIATRTVFLTVVTSRTEPAKTMTAMASRMNAKKLPRTVQAMSMMMVQSISWTCSRSSVAGALVRSHPHHNSTQPQHLRIHGGVVVRVLLCSPGGGFGYGAGGWCVHSFFVLATTIATMPAFMASDSAGHAATIMAK
jgi:hypothetical protein